MRDNKYSILVIVLIISLFIILNSFFTTAGVNSKCGGNIACVCGESLNDSRTLTASDALGGGCNNVTILNIIVNNTILDCSGNQISGNNSGVGRESGNAKNIGILLTGSQNITIKNCFLIAMGVGISSASEVNNLTLINNTFTNIFSVKDADAVGIFISSTRDTIIKDNTFQNITCPSCSRSTPTFAAAISFSTNPSDFVDNLTFQNNKIENVSGNGSKGLQDLAIALDFSFVGGSVVPIKNVVVKDNTIKNSYLGTIIAGVENFTFVNNTITDIIHSAISLDSVGSITNGGTEKNITIANNKIFNASMYGVYFGILRDIGLLTVTGTNYTLRDNLIQNSTSGIYISNITQVFLLNNTFGNNTISINSTGALFRSVIVYENQFSSLIWNQTNTTIYNNLGLNLFNSLVIANGSVFVNGTSHLNLNKTLNFTFFQVGFLNINRFYIYKDGVNCSICNKLGFNPAILNVYGFSNYSVQLDNINPSAFSLSSSGGTSINGLTATTISCSYFDDFPSNIVVTASDGASICSSTSQTCTGSYTPTTTGTKTITCSGTDVSSNSASASISITFNQVDNGGGNSGGSSGGGSGSGSSGSSSSSSETGTSSQQSEAPSQTSQPASQQNTGGNIVNSIGLSESVDVNQISQNQDSVSEVSVGEEAQQESQAIEAEHPSPAATQESAQVEGNVIAVIKTLAGNSITLKQGKEKDKNSVGLNFKTSSRDEINVKYSLVKELNNIVKPKLDLSFVSLSDVSSTQKTIKKVYFNLPWALAVMLILSAAIIYSKAVVFNKN